MPAIADMEAQQTPEPPAEVEKVEASSQETAADPSGAEPRRDLAPQQEDPPARREDAPEGN
jgi:hypothetical protein